MSGIIECQTEEEANKWTSMFLQIHFEDFNPNENRVGYLRYFFFFFFEFSMKNSCPGEIDFGWYRKNGEEKYQKMGSLKNTKNWPV
jgi:hypothetical protein